MSAVLDYLLKRLLTRRSGTDISTVLKIVGVIIIIAAAVGIFVLVLFPNLADQFKGVFASILKIEPPKEITTRVG